MPRKTKEVEVISNAKAVKKATKKEEPKPKKSTKKAAVKDATKKETKKATVKKEPKTKKTATKKSVAKNIEKKDTKTEKKSLKKDVEKKVSKATASSKKTTTKKTVEVKKTATKKSTTSKKATSKRTSKSKVPVFAAEYYDLPFRYNQTIVKILAQTPKNLFIYWEISDEDRANLKKQYGEYFFEITKPVLVVYNETLDYTFEVNIDDFANSWYLHVNDSNSEYKIELGRRPIPINYNYIPNYDIKKNGPIDQLKTSYIYISSSNELDAPNDKIMFNKLGKVYFKNIKTNEVIEKDIKDFPNIYKDGNFINIYKLYQKLYKEEIKNDSFNLYNPSSGNISSGSFSSRFY